MSTIDTSTWNPDPALNESIGDIPLNESASISQTWQAIQMLMAAGGLHGLQLVTFEGATASADGKQGLVPAPEAGDQDKVLKGDGTWGTVAAANHVHGNITSDGKVGSTANLPLITGTGGVVQAGAFGNAASTFCEGNDSRLSNARTPTSHTHGSITNDGKLGTASRAVVTDGSKVIGVSSVTSTELGYLSGVTSNVQTHLTDLDNEFLLVKGTADNCYAATTAQQLLIVDLQDDLQDLDDAVVHKTGNEIIGGTKTFSSTISGSVSGNAGTATKIQRAPDGTSFVAGCTAGNALVNATHTGYGAIWNAKTKNYGVSMTTWPSNNDNVYIMAVTNANIASGTNSYARNVSWNANDGTLTATAFSGTVQTSSDERLKTPLQSIPDPVLDAWGDVQWGQFQYLSAVECKGKEARLHLGVVAQRVKKVFEARGLDACVYGILCHSRDEDEWSVRYAEAMAMEAAYQRRRADRLEARIAALEVRFNV